MRERQAIIIGGGPAGCAAAIELARAGVRTTLVESREFPRVKVCGEFVSPAAAGILESLIPDHELIRLGARRVCEFTLECGRHSLSWPLPSAGWALSRKRLDQELLSRATTLGVDVHQPAAVREVRYGDPCVTVTLADGRELSASIVIHADGSGRHDPAGPTPNARGWLGQKCHLRLPKHGTAGVHIRSASDTYIGLIRVEEGLATCALAVRAPALARADGDVDRLLGSRWPEYDPASRCSEWLACGVPRGWFRDSGHLRSFRVGNAAAAVDPIGGEGIGLALWSGSTLGRRLRKIEWTPTELQSLRATFRGVYARRLRYRLPACRLAAHLLVRPWIVRTAWPLLSASDHSMSPWFRLTGKLDAATGTHG